MLGVVVNLSHKGHAYVRGEDRKSYLALSSNMAEDDAGRRYFILNEEIEFEPMPNKRNPGRLLAAHIRPIFREPVNLEEYRELVTLFRWTGESGSAKRPDTPNDELSVHVSAIVTEGVETLRDGARLWTRVGKPNKPGQRWRAVDAEVCVEEVAEDAQQSTAA